MHIVSARLGHSKVSITYDIYAHVIPGQDEGVGVDRAGALAEDVDRLLEGGWSGESLAERATWSAAKALVSR